MTFVPKISKARRLFNLSAKITKCNYDMKVFHHSHFTFFFNCFCREKDLREEKERKKKNLFNCFEMSNYHTIEGAFLFSPSASSTKHKKTKTKTSTKNRPEVNRSFSDHFSLNSKQH